MPTQLSDPVLTLLLAAAGVIVGSAVCSGSEAAIFSVPLNKARELAQSGGPGARALLAIRQDMRRPIATIVVLNNVANIGGSILVGGMALRLLGEAWIGVFSAALTFLIIIWAEIIPKTIGERHAVPIGLVIARPLRLITLLFTPLVWLIERLSAPFTGGAAAPSTSESEIRLLAHVGHREGVIDPEEAQLVQHVFELNDRFARDLMTPRTVLTHLESHRTLEDAKEEIIAAPHSRILISGEDTDDVLGVALKTQLLAALVRGQEGPVSALAQEVQFVPEVMRGDDLLRLFRGTRQHLAVVVDEYGGVAGVVTLEDVLEVLTGPIADETDRWVNLRAVARRKAHQRLEEIRRSREAGGSPGSG